jgi:hypothetical protein
MTSDLTQFALVRRRPTWPSTPARHSSQTSIGSPIPARQVCRTSRKWPSSYSLRWLALRPALQPPTASCMAPAGGLPAILYAVGGICTLHLAATVLGMIGGARATRPPLARP